MPSDFLSFQKFNDVGLATIMAEQLEQNGIKNIIENNQKLFDISFANNKFDADVILKIRAEDFARARTALENYYRKHLDDVDKDYYLFEFTNEELMEIIRKPDEWGFFDYVLAQRLLNDHGRQVNPVEVEQLKEQRFEKLAQPQTIGKGWISLAYFAGIFGWLAGVWGGLFGLFTGVVLAFFRKTFPDGKTIFFFNKNERDHGKAIIIISLVSFLMWFLIIRYIY